MALVMHPGVLTESTSSLATLIHPPISTSLNQWYYSDSVTPRTSSNGACSYKRPSSPFVHPHRVTAQSDPHPQESDGNKPSVEIRTLSNSHVTDLLIPGHVHRLIDSIIDVIN
ncbi:uncharacterized protein EI90DRAFT_3117478 [Cantharellus anzutake]|uniref:uncharacterized protein n=1 Tax=Cantharellus anzutake TaxID=1750568 RepID=UPI0019070095|nr:uncharacterized protein EI90DRAFT_3117478 [Cantharellus anzutake]KAF8339689.1 hypothetical protein EI90DRAFT_3117478 [Cantharellus anzutake]